jgi:hypothetical protein
MYRERIKRYIVKWGPGLWHLIYQADVRMRREEMELIRRVGAEAKALDPAHPFDPKKPWNWAWQHAAKDTEFWKDQLEDGAVQVLTHTKSVGAFLDGDAPVVGATRSTKRTADIHHESDVQDYDNGEREPRQPKKQPKIAKKQIDRNVDLAVIKDGKFQSNRRGTPLCYGYNEGTCNGAGAQPCPKVSSRHHQCWICLGTHPATECPKAGGAAATKPGRRKGKGRGKGKGQ